MKLITSQKVKKTTFCSAGDGFPSPAIGSEIQWFHPYLRPGLNPAFGGADFL